MAKVRIRIGFNQAGFLYSVRNLDTGAISSYVPGTTLPYVGVTPSLASSAAAPVRCWLLTDKVEIEDQDGTLVMEGFRGDYLLEGMGGEILIAKCGDVRDTFDLSGDVSRIYRNTPPEGIVLGDNAIGRMKNGTEF